MREIRMLWGASCRFHAQMGACRGLRKRDMPPRKSRVNNAGRT